MVGTKTIAADHGSLAGTVGGAPGWGSKAAVALRALQPGGAHTDGITMHEEPAFIDLYRTWWGVACDAAEEVLASRLDAEDAAQRVFVRLWEHGTWRTIHLLRRYFYEARRREALTILQRRLDPALVQPLKETEAPVLADPAPLPDHGLLQAEPRKPAADLIGRLPRRCQEVCVLVFLTGMGHGEVAERLGITEKAVEKQVARGRRILRKVVGFEEWLRVSTFGDGGG